MKTKEKLISLAKEIVGKKEWTAFCQKPFRINGIMETRGCLQDPETKTRTCLFCAVTEARNQIQEEKEENRTVWDIPMYMEIYPLLAKLSLKNQGKHHKKLTVAEALVVLDLFAQHPISF